MMKRYLPLILIVFIAGSFLGSVSAKGILTASIWDGISGLFRTQTEQSTTTVPDENIPLYKPAIDYEEAVVGAVEKTNPAVVSIVVTKDLPVIEQCPYDPFSNLPPEIREFFDNGQQFYQPCERGTERTEVGGGSGFIVATDGLVVTNKHVVSDKEAEYTVLLNNGESYDASVLARDPVQDIALLRIEGTDFPTVTLGDSDSIQLGQTAIAIGNALGEFRNTVSVGVVSGIARNIVASGAGVTERIEGVIQTDAAINPGNSGGPLINLRGEVIAINTAVAEDAQNIGFAIPVNLVTRDIISVEQTGEIKVPFLGVRYHSITPEFALTEELSVDHGALIRGNDDGPAIQEGSPADEAGLEAEDIIIEVNGDVITADRSLASLIQKYVVGDTITLTILRNGEERDVIVTLAEYPAL